jgi:hypothetical protein|uniref:Uncharacterized protein n=1 Tax=Dictyoglomus turgidum TaxID=513050 RepID=A0A7C3SQG3_9BACT
MGKVIEMSIVKATFVELEPGESPLYGIIDQEIINEILESPALKDLREKQNGDNFLRIPSDLSGLMISPKLKDMLEKHKGKTICISI